MAEVTSLNDVLNERAPEAPSGPAADPPPAAPAAPAATPAPDVSRGTDGKFVAKEAAPAAEPAPQKPAASAEPAKPAAPQPAQQLTEKERAFLAAAHDERRKRQELERQIQALQAAKPAAPAEPAKQFWEDPEGTLANFEKKMEGVITNTRLSTAEAIARSKYSDFDDAVSEFAEVMKTTPGLYQQWLSTSDPAEFAYRTGLNHRQLREVGSIDALRQKITQEVRAQIEGELKAKEEALKKERDALPGSLSDVHSVAQKTPVWSGPTPLDTVLGKR